ncbi:MAG: hypothetical protein JWN50_504 [Parcubacteria group bacterium]|nr:hypothetical protein [Parcubacteria group bacterium]
MKITKLEQSGFILEAENGYRLALDIASLTPIEKLEGITVDAMLVSHIHGDHFSPEHIKKLSPKKLYLGSECIEALGEEKLTSEIIEAKAGNEVDIEGIKVIFFEVDHGPNVGQKPRENFGFLIEIDSEKIYFGGDIFYPSGINVSALEVDKALIPVGGFYTFGPEEAASFAKQFKTIKEVIPMHYEKSPENKDAFLAAYSRIS